MSSIDMWDQGDDDVWKDAIQIHINVRPVEAQGRYAREDVSLKAGSVKDTFKFIAPNEINESLVHTWEPYENTSTKLAEGFKKYAEGKAFAKDAPAEIANILSGKPPGSTGSIANTRIDTPLVYTNSERRKYDFTFNLAIWSNESKILNGIQKLKNYSSPSRGEKDIVVLQTPHVFEIISYPAGFINISEAAGTGYAALTNIQTVFKGPYLTSGYCTHCELHLSFQELSPIFDSDFPEKISSIKSITETK